MRNSAPRRTISIAIGCATLGASIAACSTTAFATGRTSLHHRHARHAQTYVSPPRDDIPAHRDAREPGVVGYFGPPPFYGYGYGYGPGWGAPRGDVGFALLGLLNGGGFRGFVECGNYYARYPGACGF